MISLAGQVLHHNTGVVFQLYAVSFHHIAISGLHVGVLMFMFMFMEAGTINQIVPPAPLRATT